MAVPTQACTSGQLAAEPGWATCPSPDRGVWSGWCGVLIGQACTLGTTPGCRDGLRSSLCTEEANDDSENLG